MAYLPISGTPPGLFLFFSGLFSSFTRGTQSVATFFSVSDMDHASSTYRVRGLYCWYICYNLVKLQYHNTTFSVFIILQLYEDSQSDSPVNHGVSDDVHLILIIPRVGGYLQHVNWFAIPSTTHHGAPRDRLSDCVGQPGHTAPWKQRQEDMVCCIPIVFVIEIKVAPIVASRRIASPNVFLSATI